LYIDYKAIGTHLARGGKPVVEFFFVVWGHHCPGHPNRGDDAAEKQKTTGPENK
jgi:hypothetical protein